jgi:hypothetical protein
VQSSVQSISGEHWSSREHCLETVGDLYDKALEVWQPDELLSSRLNTQKIAIALNYFMELEQLLALSASAKQMRLFVADEHTSDSLDFYHAAALLGQAGCYLAFGRDCGTADAARMYSAAFEATQHPWAQLQWENNASRLRLWTLLYGYVALLHSGENDKATMTLKKAGRLAGGLVEEEELLEIASTISDGQFRVPDEVRL